MKINIKDYIEVNSAIALSLEGLGIGTKEANFKHNGKLEGLLTIDFGGNSKNKSTSAKMEESTKSLQNNVSIEYIESRMSSKLSEIRRVLARNGIDENLIDDINLENKSFMRKLLTRIEENVNTETI